MIFQPGESMKAFSLRFTKLYNKILEIIRPHEQVSLINYYDTIPHVYKNILEDKFINDIATSLQTYLEYEDQIKRIGLHVCYTNKSQEITSILQLMQDINNHMISFERRVSMPMVISPYTSIVQPLPTLPTPISPSPL